MKIRQLSQGYLAPTFRGLAYSSTAVLSLALVAWAFGESFTPSYSILAILAVLLVFPLFRRLELEPSWTLGRSASVGTRVVFTWFVLAFVVLGVAVFTNLVATLSPFVLLGWILGTPLLFFLLHLLVRHGLTRLFPSMLRPRTAAVVFMNDAACDFVEALAAETRPEFMLAGYFEDREPERVAVPPPGFQRLGGIGDLRDYVNAHKIEAVFVALPPIRTSRTHEVVAALGDTTASIYYIPQLPLIDLSHIRLTDIGGMSIFVLDETPFLGADGFFKRMMDIAASAFILLLAMPVMFVITVAIWLTMGRPIVFTQPRYGLNGEEIRVHKFRSMRVTEERGNVIQATRDDPRVTPVGRFLRRTSLDELPQLWNVLRGDMSLVGPRPHAVDHNEAYRKQISSYMTRHKVRPGMTGWAQVHGYRGEIKEAEDMAQRVRYDLEYMRSWSPELDIKIILRTLWIIFRDPEAY